MKQVIDGKLYNTETAQEVCELYCTAHATDFAHHDTKLYVTKNGNYFLAGAGGPASIWAEDAYGGGRCGGHGIRVLSKDDARVYAERMLDEDDLRAAGFDVEEG
jgi:hypothetical protein